MVIEHLRRTKPRGIALKRELLNLPPPQALSELYHKIFQHATKGDFELQRKLSCALEVLAISRRPLSLAEFVYATTLAFAAEHITDFSTLEAELEDADSLLDLIRPFICEPASESARSNPSLHLVHQSLKELVLN